MALVTKRNFTQEEIKRILSEGAPEPCVSLGKTPLPTWTTWNGTRIDNVKVTKTACSRNCYSTCGIRAYVKDGKLIKVDGDPDHPINRGTLCVKGYTYPQRVYSPDRIKYPMMRTGERGEGKFKRISWEQAWDFICEKLTDVREKYGSEAFVEYAYSGNREFLGKQIAGRFHNLFGSSKLVGSF